MNRRQFLQGMGSAVIYLLNPLPCLPSPSKQGQGSSYQGRFIHQIHRPEAMPDWREIDFSKQGKTHDDIAGLVAHVYTQFTKKPLPDISFEMHSQDEFDTLVEKNGIGQRATAYSETTEFKNRLTGKVRWEIEAHLPPQDIGTQVLYALHELGHFASPTRSKGNGCNGINGAQARAFELASAVYLSMTPGFPQSTQYRPRYPGDNAEKLLSRAVQASRLKYESPLSRCDWLDMFILSKSDWLNVFIDSYNLLSNKKPREIFAMGPAPEDRNLFEKEW